MLIIAFSQKNKVLLGQKLEKLLQFDFDVLEGADGHVPSCDFVYFN